MASAKDPANLFNIEKLNRDNFREWRFNLKMILMHQDLLGFVDGSEARPDSDDKALKLWNTRDARALSTICLSIDEDLKNLVIDCENARSAWDSICGSFEPTTRARIAALRTDFMNMRLKDTESMSMFIGRLLRAAKDLELAGKVVPDDEIAYQMLCQLPPNYDNVVIQLYQLGDEDFTSLNIRKALLAEYDRLQHRNEIGDSSRPADTALASETETRRRRSEGKPRKGKKCTIKCYRCGFPGHFARDCKTGRKTPTETFKDTGDNSKNAFLASAAMVVDSDSVNFVIDTAATEHFCNDITLFSDYHKYPEVSPAKIAEGSTPILGYGNLKLYIHQRKGKKFLLLRNVLHAPKMTRNLISGRLIDNAGYSIFIRNGKLIIREPNGSFFLESFLCDKLYPLNADVKHEKPEGYIATENDLMLWHARFGHQNSRELLNIVKSKDVFGIEKLKGEIESCEVCEVTKSKRVSFKPINKISTKHVLELLHMDLWGPAPVESLGRSKYFLSIIDDYSRYSAVYFLRNKDQVFECFKKYQVEMERQTGRKIKRIRTDNGLEFCARYFEDYLQNSGIRFERTNPYSPEMNGVAERFNRTIVEGARASLCQGNLPKSLWAEVVNTQNYLKNRFPHKSLNGKIPLNIWSGKRFSIRHLRTIGSEAFIHVPKLHRDKLDKKAQKGILVGYASKTKGYRIWKPKTKEVIETKHVKVIEPKVEPKLRVSHSISNFILDMDFPHENLESEPETKENPKTVSQDQGQPDKWVRKVVTRTKGQTAGRRDVYYYPKNNVRLRSLNEVEKYCIKEGINFNPEDFDFSKRLNEPEVEDSSEESDLNSDHEVSYSEKCDLSSDHEACCAEVRVPLSFRESQMVPEKPFWDKAMREEIDTIKSRNVYEIVPRPSNHKVLGSRWVYNLKKDFNGKIRAYKARFVAQGFRQTEGIDFYDIFSPVVNFTLVKFFMILLVVLRNWKHRHLDVKCAYLYSNLREETYVEQPKGFVEFDNKDYVLKLKKALYGLRQAGREWFFTLNEVLVNLGFQQMKNCNCVYFLDSNVIMLVYVDDLALFASNDTNMKNAIGLLNSKFEIKDLGPISKFLGVDFEIKNQKLLMHQKGYIEKMIEVFKGVPKVKCKLPMNPGLVIERVTDENSILKDIPYRSLIGSLLFLASRTRPDIMFAVTFLSKYSNNPSAIHWKLLCQVFNYVVDTKHYCINLSDATNSYITAYCDASWAADRDDRKSVNGFIVLFGGVPISWLSAKQQTIALSSMEAEFISLSELVKEVIWLLRIINENCLGMKVQKPIIFCDSQSAMYFSKNLVETRRTKHVDTRYFFVKDYLKKDYFSLCYVPGKENLGDMLTKALNFDKLKFFCDKIFFY